MKERMLGYFRDIYGDPDGVRVFFAPGRVNLIGEHTDYNGGHVFPCAITIGTYAAARRREDKVFHFYSVNDSQLGVVEAELKDLDYRAQDGWSNYPKGVVATFLGKGYAVTHGLDIVYYGEIPGGLGLGSSASLEVVTGLILKELMGLKDVSRMDLALFAQLTENEYLGMKSGIMDPFTSAMGKKDHAIFLDTSNFSYIYAPMCLPHEKIIITNSGKARVDVDERYSERKEECARALKELQALISIHDLGELTAEVFEQVQELITDPVCVRRARHAVTENQRTMQAVEALKRWDIREFGELMNASHLSLKEDYEVSCEELDVLVEEAWELDGVLGSRMMGAGFGGCTVSIVEEEAVDRFIDQIGKRYRARTGRTAEFYVVQIGDGARELEPAILKKT